MTREEYKNKRKALMDEAQALIDKADYDGYEAKEQEIKDLDSAYEKSAKAQANLNALNLSIETCGNVFASSSQGASANYGIGSDGRVGMYVEEKDRSWCSSSRANDYHAVTIEVANDGGAPDWHVSDKAFNTLIDLCVDICKRNGFRLNYTGDASGSLTRHNMFAATACPGPYLQGRFAEIARLVNDRLDDKTEDKPATQRVHAGPDDPGVDRHHQRPHHQGAVRQCSGAYIR